MRVLLIISLWFGLPAAVKCDINTIPCGDYVPRSEYGKPAEFFKSITVSSSDYIDRLRTTTFQHRSVTSAGSCGTATSGKCTSSNTLIFSEGELLVRVSGSSCRVALEPEGRRHHRRALNDDGDGDGSVADKYVVRWMSLETSFNQTLTVSGSVGPETLECNLFWETVVEPGFDIHKIVFSSFSYTGLTGLEVDEDTGLDMGRRTQIKLSTRIRADVRGYPVMVPNGTCYSGNSCKGCPGNQYSKNVHGCTDCPSGKSVAESRTTCALDMTCSEGSALFDNGFTLLGRGEAVDTDLMSMAYFKVESKISLDECKNICRDYHYGSARRSSQFLCKAISHGAAGYNTNGDNFECRIYVYCLRNALKEYIAPYYDGQAMASGSEGPCSYAKVNTVKNGTGNAVALTTYAFDWERPGDASNNAVNVTCEKWEIVGATSQISDTTEDFSAVTNAFNYVEYVPVIGGVCAALFSCCGTAFYCMKIKKTSHNRVAAINAQKQQQQQQQQQQAAEMQRQRGCDGDGKATAARLRKQEDARLLQEKDKQLELEMNQFDNKFDTPSHQPMPPPPQPPSGGSGSSSLPPAYVNALIKADPIHMSVPPPLAAAPTKFCNHCGSAVKGSVFCTKCGKHL